MPDESQTEAERAEQHFDVVVIGAGVAGAMSALLASRAGYRTLLVDRQKFPRSKVCGCCLNDRAIQILKKAGLKPQLDQLAPVTTHSLSIRYGGRGLKIAMPENMAISRRVFDQWLIDQAVNAGCRFLDEVTASVDPLDGENDTIRQAVTLPKELNCETADAGPQERGVRLTFSGRVDCDPVSVGEKRVRSSGFDESSLKDTGVHESYLNETRSQSAGQSARVWGRVILVCDGLGHPSLSRMNCFQAVPETGSRIGLGAIFPRTPDDAWILPHEILMAVSRHGYAGVVEIEQGQLNLAAAVDPGHLQQTKSPQETLRMIFRSAGIPIPAALAEATVRGTMPLTRSASRISGHRLFLLGDSTGYIEPFTGEGMAWALTAATAVMPLVAACVHGSCSSELSKRWLATFQGTVKREQKFCRLLSAALRRPWMLPPVLSVCRLFPAASQYMIRQINRIPEPLEIT